MIKNTAFCIAFALLAAGSAFSQKQVNNIPKIIEKNGRHALIVDGSPYLVLGAQAHNSSDWPAMLPQVWQAIKEVHANTLEIPIYWEQIEPQQGKFDFSIVNTLLAQARQQKVRLVLLWFGTWKNGSNHYLPEWMKREPAKYTNLTNRKGQVVDSPSPVIQATMDADIKAFATVMRYLKKADLQHTVIMMQVENESGSWYSVRDYSAFAQKLFEGPVPAELLKPEVLKELNTPPTTGGSWQKVFGNNADEYFHAWHVANFIGKVAAAGKAEYALPMYANAAIRDPLTNPSANTYESGGPTDNVIPIWKAAAPALDFVGPDIYINPTPKVSKLIDLYNRPDNTLFVPEASFSADKPKYIYKVIADGGIGFSPFGVDNNVLNATDAEPSKKLLPFAQEYKMATPMMRDLAKWGFEGKIKAVIEGDDHADQTVDLGAWQAIVSFGAGGRNLKANGQSIAKAMIIKLDENKFIIIGTLCHFTFKPLGKNQDKPWQFLKMEEGYIENGVFKPQRTLNGDETDFGGPRFGAVPTVLQTTLIVQ